MRMLNTIKLKIFKKMTAAITTENQYKEALVIIENYLKKGSNVLTFDEKQELRRISLLVEAYEQQMYPMPI